MARCVVLGDFCAAPGLDVKRGWVLEAEPWMVKTWVGIGHAAWLGAPEVAPSGHIVDYGRGVSVVSRGEPEAAATAASGGDQQQDGGGEQRGVEAVDGAASGGDQQQETADGGGDAGEAEHPESAGDAVVTRPQAARTREPRRPRG